MRTILMVLAAGLTFTVAAAAQASPKTPADDHSRMQQDSQPASLASSMNKGKTKLTGCIRKENGKYLLEGQNKKSWLSGSEDLEPQVGHTVVLYGDFLNTSTPGAAKRTASTTDASTASGKPENNFQVTSLEKVADSCTPKNLSNTNSSSSSDQEK